MTSSLSPLGTATQAVSPKQYHTIYCDPPWPESGGGKIKRGADRHYPLMTIKEIIALPVRELAFPDAHLYLWTTNNYLPEALIVMQAWGWRYVTMITWAKERIGLGQYYRGQTEHCLFGVRGNLPYRYDERGGRLQGTTLIQAPKGRHSEKPPEMRMMIERVSPAPRIELFARERVEGWDAWGDEVESDVELGMRQEPLLIRDLVEDKLIEDHDLIPEFRPAKLGFIDGGSLSL